MGINGQAGVLARKALVRVGQPELLPGHVEQIGSVAAVEHGESRVETHDVRILAQEAIADRMKSARPQPTYPCFRECPGAARAQRLNRNTLGSSQHFLRCAPREREQQNPFRCDTVDEQVRDAMCERVGLAGTSTGDDEQGSGAPSGRMGCAERSRSVLLGIEMLVWRSLQLVLKCVHRRGKRGAGCAYCI